jgi:chromosome segregation ATPase
VSDHHHYGYADERHSHRGEYAEDRHDHDGDYAEKYHRHYDDESTVSGLREDLSHAEERVRELENDLRDAFERIRALEGQTPQAQRLQLEADQAAADLAESGYGEPW